ncbi:hypothetical protein [Seonamhaeicola sp.]|uniref:hypothetical protein n=1 Tax=Seonamhaeicola sp. TaxID=1912245 RepID=UPI00260362F9|nr:hypothetical protein [Seonamhaeicola sp.]
MKYSIGDCVKNTRVKKYSNGDIIALGTPGDVRKVYKASKSYSIMFQGAQAVHRVLEKDLEAC